MRTVFVKSVGILLFLVNFSGKLISNQYQKGNEIQIFFLKNRKKIRYSITNREQIRFFKDLIKNGKNMPTLKCDSTGEIIYLKNHRQLFKAYFSTRITGSKFQTPTVIFNDKNAQITSQISYSCGMIIDEVYSRLKTSY